MTYEIYKAAQNILSNNADVLSKKLNTYPRGAFGMTPEEVKATAEWQADYAGYHRAHNALRDFNGTYCKMFKKQDAEARKAKRMAVAA